jgi:hypothetical protein
MFLVVISVRGRVRPEELGTAREPAMIVYVNKYAFKYTYIYVSDLPIGLNKYDINLRLYSRWL